MADYKVTLTPGDEYRATVATGVSAVYVDNAFATRAALATWLATNTAVSGMVYFGGRLEFIGQTGSTEIADLPGLVPLWHPSPEHYAENTTPGTTDMAAALALADTYARGARGRRLVIDQNVGLASALNLKAEAIEGEGRFIVLSTYSGATSVPCIKVGSDSATLNDGKLNARFFVDGLAYFGKAKSSFDPAGGGGVFPPDNITANWDAASGAFPAAAAVNARYYVTGAGTVSGQAFSVGDVLFATIPTPSTSVFEDNWRKASVTVTGDGYKALTEGTIAGRAINEGDILVALMDNPSRSTLAGNWRIVPTGVAVAGTWSPSGGTFPSGSTAGNAYRATTYGTITDIYFRPGDLITAKKNSASTSVWASNWERIYPGIPAVQIEGTARGLAEVHVEAQNCDIACVLRGNTEKIEATVAGIFNHGLYFEYSFEKGDGDASSPDNILVTLRGSSCGWWTWREGTTLSEYRFAVQNQLAEYKVPAHRDYATRVATYAGVSRTPRYIPALHIWQRVSPDNSGVNLANFEIANPLGYGNPIYGEATVTGVTGTDRGSNAVTGQVRLGSAAGGVNLEQEKGSCLSIVGQNMTAGTLLTLGRTSKSTTSSNSRFVAIMEGSSGATGSVNLDSVQDMHVDYQGVAVAASATTAVRASLTLPVQFLKSVVAYPSVTGLAVEFPAARSAYRFTASGDGATVTFAIGSLGSSANAYARTSYIVLPGNTYTAGLNFAVITPDGNGNPRVTFTAAPAVGTNNLAFEVLIS